LDQEEKRGLSEESKAAIWVQREGVGAIFRKRRTGPDPGRNREERDILGKGGR